MSTPDDQTTPGPSFSAAAAPALIGRRVLARLMDDVLLVALVIVIVLKVYDRLDVQSVSPGGLLQGWSAWAPPLGDATYRTYEYGGEGELGGSTAGALFLSGVLSLSLVAAYVTWSARTAGTTIGRAILGLRVVSVDGTPALPRVIAGRELIRFATIGLAISFLALVAMPFLDAGASVFAGDYGSEVSQIRAVAGVLLPFGMVLATLLGAAMIHPEGRALHDRWSRTRVVRADGTA